MARRLFRPNFSTQGGRMTLVCVNGSPAGHALRHIGRKIRAARPQAGQGRRQRRRAAGSAADLCGNASEPVSAGALGFGCAGLCARGAGGPVSAGVAGGLGCGTSGHWNSWCVVRRASISRPPLLTASGVLADVHQPSQQEHLRVRLPRSLPDALRGLGHGRLPQGVLHLRVQGPGRVPVNIPLRGIKESTAA